MDVTVVGCGAGACAAAVELLAAGHDVRVWSRSEATIAPHVRRGGIAYEGVLGEGLAVPSRMTTDLAGALRGAEAAIVVLPTFLHADVARSMIEADMRTDLPVILNPGHTGGALEFAQVFVGMGRRPPPLVEFSTLTYVARKYAPDSVTVSGRAGAVKAASLGAAPEVLDLAGRLFPGVTPVRDVIASGLANVNMVLHAPGSVLAAAWVEATGGNFTFYVDAMTEGVARVVRALDGERLAVARAFGHDLPNLMGEMQLIGTIDSLEDPDDYRAAISTGSANQRIRGPGSFDHRYYKEDFGHGLLPFLEFGRVAGIDVPVADALMRLAQTAVGVDYRVGGRTAEAMGLAGLSMAGLLEKVRAA